MLNLYRELTRIIFLTWDVLSEAIFLLSECDSVSKAGRSPALLQADRSIRVTLSEAIAFGTSKADRIPLYLSLGIARIS